MTDLFVPAKPALITKIWELNPGLLPDDVYVLIHHDIRFVPKELHKVKERLPAYIKKMANLKAQMPGAQVGILMGRGLTPVPGTAYYATAGSYSLTIPLFNSLIARVFGGGGGGSYAGNGGNGAASVFNPNNSALRIQVNGGVGGTVAATSLGGGNPGDGGTVVTGPGGGIYQNGSSAAGPSGSETVPSNGGAAGGTAYGGGGAGNGNIYGGGGRGGPLWYNSYFTSYMSCGGGGGGAFGRYAYGPSEINSGDTASITVGGGGGGSNYSPQSGAVGGVFIDWS